MIIPTYPHFYLTLGIAVLAFPIVAYRPVRQFTLWHLFVVTAAFCVLAATYTWVGIRGPSLCLIAFYATLAITSSVIERQHNNRSAWWFWLHVIMYVAALSWTVFWLVVLT